jgi:hypothetical protein
MSQRGTGAEWEARAQCKKKRNKTTILEEGTQREQLADCTDMGLHLNYAMG